MDFDFVDFCEIGLLIVIKILVLDPNLLIVFELELVVYQIVRVNLQILRSTKGMEVLIMAVFIDNGFAGMLAHSQNVDSLLRKNHEVIVSMHETPDS